MGLRRLLTLVVLTVFVALPALPQGNPTGTLTGRVSNEGVGLPGVTVTAKSPSLQGQRQAVTGGSGDYLIPLLPAGNYTISFEISGFQSEKRDIYVAAAQTMKVDASLKLAAVAAEAVVTAEKETISQTQQVATTWTSETTGKLPIARTFQAAVLLTPGTTANGPNNGIVISGAQSYENLFMINGVVVNENIRGQALDLYIEDAVQETTTTTGAISAEYGRFAGGVVNVLTKSGGNSFSGSFRATLANDSWSAETPLNETRTQKVNPTYEATLGGPFWKDHVWFFGAGRFVKTEGVGSTSFTNISYNTTRDQKRYEGKLTLSPIQGHTLLGSYVQIDDASTNGAFGLILDTLSLSNRSDPQKIYSGNYTGVIADNVFVEAQYSKRRYDIAVGFGAKATDFVGGTLIRDRSRSSARYYTPTFCGVCDIEKRDNENVLFKGNYFLSNKAIGSHNISLGYDYYNDIRFANNHQSGSDYRLLGQSAYIRNGTVYPVIAPGTGTRIQWTPIYIGAQDNNFKTHSVFLNDAWQMSDRLSFNVGVRWDKNSGLDSQGNLVANDSKLSPRLGLVYDVFGNGSFKVNAFFARYVTAIANSVGDSGSAGGVPSSIQYYYGGPAVNQGVTDATPDGQLVSAADTLRIVQTWLFANGANVAGGPNRDPFSVSLSGFNTKIDGSLNSPNTDEISLGVQGKIGTRGAFRVDGIYRKSKDFYADRTDLSTGTILPPAFTGFNTPFDLTLVQNSSVPERKYYGMNLQFSFRPMNRVQVGGNWTWSHAYGNFDGENAGSGPVTFTGGDYPEYKDPRWNTPRGDLSIDQRHKVRLYANVDLPIPSAFGTLGVGTIFSFDTGTPYGAVGSVDSTPYVTNPGYKTPPSGGVDYWFTSRDAFRTPDVNRTDVVLNYGFHIRTIADTELFIRPRVLNVFNNRQIIDGTRVNTTVLTANNASGFKAFNPFTTAPVQRTDPNDKTANWAYASTFGTALNFRAYQQPRTFDISVGIRF